MHSRGQYFVGSRRSIDCPSRTATFTRLFTADEHDRTMTHRRRQLTCQFGTSQWQRAHPIGRERGSTRVARGRTHRREDFTRRRGSCALLVGRVSSDICESVEGRADQCTRSELVFDGSLSNDTRDERAGARSTSVVSLCRCRTTQEKDARRGRARERARRQFSVRSRRVSRTGGERIEKTKFY
jgi:hypothetical protein